MPRITENKYMNKIPITKVGRDTPNSDVTNMKLLTKPSRLIAVYTPKNTPKKIAIKAETKTNSSVAGNRSEIKSETGLLNSYDNPNSPFEALTTNLKNWL